MGAARSQRYVLARSVPGVGREVLVMRVNALGQSTPFARFHTLPTRALRVDSALDYPRLADQAMQGTHPGSSAGGEQPKFCTLTAGRPVLVMFSPAGDSAVDQRSRDLLVCEHLARPPQPTAATLPEWAQAKTLAAAFWQAAADDARVSEGFRVIAAENLCKIRL